jgi:hypothetical protein
LSDAPKDIEPHYADSTYHALPAHQELERIANRERYKVDAVLRHIDGGRLLEIGASFGVFAHLARGAGFDVTAVEMDETCCRYMSDELGIQAICTDDPARECGSLPSQDVIALWQSVEHLRDSWHVVDCLATKVTAGGILVISTPNPDSLQFRLLGSLWPHLDAPRHTCLIPLPALTAFLASRGFDRAEVSATDRGARSCNRFGWGTFLGYPWNAPAIKRLAYWIGCAISIVMAPLELTDTRGSTYTAIFRKRAGI